MACVGDDREFAVGQCLVQFPCTARRANNIIAPLNDNGWNGLDRLGMVQDMGFLQENCIDEIMAFNSCKGNCKIKVLSRVQEIRKAFTIIDLVTGEASMSVEVKFIRLSGPLR